MKRLLQSKDDLGPEHAGKKVIELPKGYVLVAPTPTEESLVELLTGDRRRDMSPILRDPSQLRSYASAPGLDGRVVITQTMKDTDEFVDQFYITPKPVPPNWKSVLDRVTFLEGGK